MSRCVTDLLLSIALLWAAVVPCLAAAPGNIVNGFQPRMIGTSDGLPSDNVQQVFQDSEGYMWFATRNGLARYDGFGMEVFKSDIRNGDLLTNNSITCLAEDSMNRVWIGTPDGLNMLDKRTARLKKIRPRALYNNPVSAIIATRCGRVLLGTDQGLYEYFPERDSCALVTREMTGDVMPQTSVKSLLEDSRGNIWIGTWNEGLYRLDPEGIFHSYPRLNERKSAHVLFEDSRHRIWIGSWGCGLHLLRNPYDPEKATVETFSHIAGDEGSLSDNIIYSISEDRRSRTLWVGTRRGISLLGDDASRFTHIMGALAGEKVREVTSIISDRSGMMWASMLGGGAVALMPQASGMAIDRLEPVRERFGTGSVKRVIVDRNGRYWLSLNDNLGLVVYDPADGSVISDSAYPFSASTPSPYTVQSLYEDCEGRIYVGTYDAGLYILSRYGAPAEHHTYQSSPWVAGNRVSVICHDSARRLWTGALPGLSVRMTDGSFCRFDSLLPSDIHVNSIAETDNGTIWVGTQNLGIFRIDGEGTNPRSYTIKHYCPAEGNLNSAMVTVVYNDASGRLWVGTDGSGLSLYDYDGDSFMPVHVKWNLPGDMISSILGDSRGNLWIGTNMGLINLKMSGDTSHANYRVYTATNGAQDNIFNRNAAAIDGQGRMVFGGPRGLNILTSDFRDSEIARMPVTITGLEVFGTSWYRMPEDVRNAVSELSPGYTECVTLRHDQNNFSIDFSVLDYVSHPVQHKYAYRMDGFDNDWHTTDMSRRFAYYNNLPPGEYLFRVKASDAEGRWMDQERLLRVDIRPPFWATWWAKCIYFAVFCAIAAAAFRISRRRVIKSNALHLRELELAQAEEMNKTRLRFFTNITHEWLTPLSIISAVAEEMKGSTPEQQDNHRIMTASINRLSRMLQQVLEFRKAETGNLRLRVSQGDLSAMLADIVSNMAPVMKARGLKCSFRSDPPLIRAWYDPDKIDKIMYNLLSNASKYVLPGGNVEVSLAYDASSGHAIIRVGDDGPGIAAENIPGLFRRFYEGEYRRYNTNGNGIGLSLTRDLVELHHGRIDVKSAEGIGTEFIVSIPVTAEAFEDTEKDSLPLLGNEAAETEDVPRPMPEDADGSTILIVEDDADLLKVMERLLARYYNVLTASSAEKACEIVSDNDVDLIISDMIMPEMGGVEFCRFIKGNIESSHIPVLLLTANTMEEAEVDAYEAGADGFMPKPFSLNVLMARISNLLRIRKAANRDFRGRFAADLGAFDYSQLDEGFLKDAVECITAHIDDPGYSQTMFIQEMGVSKSTLFRKLKSLTGLSYSSFVRNIRLKTACRIMRERRDIRISELAYAVGFNDPKYFSLCFRKEFGILPSEYMERLGRGEDL